MGVWAESAGVGGTGWPDGSPVRSGSWTPAVPLLGGGVSLGTPDDFAHRSAAAAALRPGHSDLLTVSVGTSSGRFILTDYSGHSFLGDGRALAAALGDLPLYGYDVRVWLDRDESAEDRRTLRRNLSELAALTGATIWAPADGGRVEILDDCWDLSAVGFDGQPTRWEPYGEDRERRFAPDVDGRLVPAGGVAVSSYPGVPLVSVLPERERDMIDWYESRHSEDGLFRVDLEVLTDGRLALRYDDGSLLALGRRHFAQVLQRFGWNGGTIVLLSFVSPEQAIGTRRHVDRLADHLGCRLIVSELPRQAALEPIGHAPRTGPDGSSGEACQPIGHALATGKDRSSGEAMGYSTGAVGRALAALDPGDRHDRALLIKITAAIADHTTCGGRLARAQGAEIAEVGRELAGTAELIASLTAPWRHEPARAC